VDPAAKKAFTLDEVKKHRFPHDAWVIFNDKVYDVSDWYEHPGGAVIFTHAGDDMTDIFAAFHEPGSRNMMGKFYIGDLITETVPTDQRQHEFEKGYRDLRAKLMVLGMFKSSKLFYAWKYFSNLSIWAGGCYLMGTSDSVWLHAVSGLCSSADGWLMITCITKSSRTVVTVTTVVSFGEVSLKDFRSSGGRTNTMGTML
jgi:acyl-lipid Delta6-acetylenase / acyl-lipid (9-3)-desaturase